MSMLAVSAVAAAIGSAALGPLSEPAHAQERPATSLATPLSTDTATARLHISGMTCATCPVTARVALTKLAGVYSATVTFADSVGVVLFDPRKVKPAEITAHLTKMTGYAAKVLPDSAKAKPPGQR